jgi:hypothetical protein
MWPTIYGEIVVELSLRPCDVIRKMTGLAGRRESCDCMIGVDGRIVIAGVTAVAIPRQVVALAVAYLALETAVCSLQRPDLVVVERRAIPTVGRRSMTGLTIGGETSLPMIGISGRPIVR